MEVMVVIRVLAFVAAASAAADVVVPAVALVAIFFAAATNMARIIIERYFGSLVQERGQQIALEPISLKCNPQRWRGMFSCHAEKESAAAADG